MEKIINFLLGAAAFLICMGVDASISRVQVTGDKRADILFRMSEPNPSLPDFTLRENIIELSFKGAEIDRDLEGKLDLSAPHALIHRISLFQPVKHTVKAQVVVNGSVDNLKDRIQLIRADSGITLKVAYPVADSPALKLLQEEQAPIGSSVTAGRAHSGKSRWAEIVVLAVALVFFLVGGLVAVRFLKTRGKLGGSRKFLIETLSYCPLGPNAKVGVGLIKVGQEFVLVGVTATQVTLLTRLEKLAEQYEEESRFERKTFNEAFEAELSRLGGHEKRGVAA